jgi:outer membrane protein OmpA-like peptidoglycan-associated protein
MKDPLRIVVGLACLGFPVALVSTWEVSAGARLTAESPAGGEAAAPIASPADEGYCTAELRKVLRRVLQSCGLAATGEVRGCQPLEARKVATMSGTDFNALFQPLVERAGIVQFEKSSADLDAADLELLDRVFADQRGASWFFVVARSSPEGSELFNRDLSQKRAQAVLDHLTTTFQDPDLAREVGLLWLGEEYAQLDSLFCSWPRSGAEESCTSAELNRSAFVAWIDCRI